MGKEENSNDLLICMWPSENGCDNNLGGKFRLRGDLKTDDKDLDQTSRT